jgi:hypothetical protein
VDGCNDIDALKENLKGATKLLMNYQHILNRVLKEQIEANLTETFGDLKLDNS